MTNSVNSVETSKPQTMAVATGSPHQRVAAEAGCERKSPAMVVSEVIKMGMTRRRAA